MTTTSEQDLSHRLAASQVGLVVRYGLRIRRWIPVALILSLLLAAAVEYYRRSAERYTYVSETIAIVRPQAAFTLTPEATVVNNIAAPDYVPGFLPEPLGVVDYALLIKSHDVMDAVANSYNEKHGAGAITTGAIRGYLHAITKLEIKTPYAVRYHPTIQLRVETPRADMTDDLVRIWLEESVHYCQELTASVKSQTHAFVNDQYRKTLDRLIAAEGPPHRPASAAEDNPQVHALEIESLRDRVAFFSRCLAEAELALANDVPEFMVASAPSPATVRVSKWPRIASPLAALLSFILLCIGGMLLCILRDIRLAIADESAPT